MGNYFNINKFKLNGVFNGHILAIVACGISDKDYFYYRGPHDKGAVFMAVEKTPKEEFLPVGMREIMNITIQCLQQFPVDHKIFVGSLLEWNHTKYEWKWKKLVAHFEKDLYISFEKKGKMYKVTDVYTKNIKPYNHAVANIWFIFAFIFELLGLPLLFFTQNTPVFIISSLGSVFLVIGMILTYLQVVNKYSK